MKKIVKKTKKIKEVQTDLRRAISLETEIVDTRLTDIYEQVIAYKNRPKKILFFDIETSFNICWSWSIGRKISLSDENILEERKIICICYKWAGDEKTYSLTWKNGDDKEILQKFAKIALTADEVIGHNSDQFDVKHIRTRCIIHNIAFPIKLNQVDTLKMSRAGYKLNSNKLNYIGQVLNEGKKVDTGGIQLWKDIVLHNSKPALAKMVEYCIGDVVLLEKVYNRLQEFSPKKKFKYKL